MSQTIGVVDLGTGSIKALIGEKDDTGVVQVLGVGRREINCDRIRVADRPEKAGKYLRQALERAKEMALSKPDSLYAGIGADLFDLKLNEATVSVPNEGTTIGKKDVERLLELARNNLDEYGKTVVHSTPRSYKIDGQKGVSDPVGMFGNRLDVTLEVITASKKTVNDLSATFNNAGFRLDGTIPYTWARGSFFNQSTGIHDGRIVVDIGYNKTELSIYRSEDLCFSEYFPVGGKQVTGDLSAKLNVNPEGAEEIKRGLFLHERQKENNSLEYEDFSGESRELDVSQIRDVLTSRLGEIFDMVIDEVQGSGYSQFTDRGITLVGGVARSPGILDFLRNRYELTFKRGLTPADVRGLEDIISNPVYTNALGLLIKAGNFAGGKSFNSEEKTVNRLRSLLKKFKKVLTDGLQG